MRAARLIMMVAALAACADEPVPTRQDAGRALQGLSEVVVSAILVDIRDSPDRPFKIINTSARTAAEIAFSTNVDRAVRDSGCREITGMWFFGDFIEFSAANSGIPKDDSFVAFQGRFEDGLQVREGTGDYGGDLVSENFYVIIKAVDCPGDPVVFDDGGDSFPPDADFAPSRPPVEYPEPEFEDPAIGY